MRALNADVSFLASKQIIDYSLLVGVDFERKLLCVGLIGIGILDGYQWHASNGLYKGL